MTITVEEFKRWCKDPRADSVLTFELDYMAEEAGEPVQRTLYVSDKPFRRSVNRYYAIIATIADFERSLGGERFTAYASSFGPLLLRPDKELQALILDYAMDGSQWRCKLGDTAWDIADHPVMDVGLIARVQRANVTDIQIELQDAGLFLNKSIGGDALIGGTGPNADKPRPINFGLVRQCECFLVDATENKYCHSDSGDNTLALDVQVRLESVGFADNGDGTVTLDATPPHSGIVTANVLALPPFADPSDVTRHLVSDAMDTVVGLRTGLVAEDLYAGAHPSFTIGDDQDFPLGFNITDTRSIPEFLAELCASGLCSWAFNRSNQFQYLRIRPNDLDSVPMVPFDIRKDDIDATVDPDIEHELPKYYRLRGYCDKNWKLTDDIAGDVIDSDQYARKTRPGLAVEQDDAVGDTYADRPELYDKSMVLSPMLDTWFSGDEDDDNDLAHFKGTYLEVARANGLPHLEYIKTVRVGMEFYDRELGDVARLTFDRWGFDDGELVQVVGIKRLYTARQIELTLLRRRLSTPYPEGWERVTTDDETGAESAFVYDSEAPPSVVPPPVSLPTAESFLPGSIAGAAGYLIFTPFATSTTEFGYIRSDHFVGGIQAYSEFTRAAAMTSDGLLAVVGIPSLAPSTPIWNGEVRVFQRSGLSWSLLTTLTATAVNDQIGTTVAIADNGTVVASENNGGHYHIWTRTGPSTWTHQNLTDTGTISEMALPSIVISRDGNVIVLQGSFGDVYISIWKLVSGTWTHMQYININPDAFQNFDVSIDGQLIVATTLLPAGVGLHNTGIRVYQANGPMTSWALTNNIIPVSETGNTSWDDTSQVSLSADKSLFAVVCPADQDGTGVGGTVFVYKSDGGARWELQTWLRINSSVGLNTSLGSVAVNDTGTRMIVGGPFWTASLTPGDPGYGAGRLWYVDLPKFLLSGPQYLEDVGVEIRNPYATTTDFQRFAESIACSSDAGHLLIRSANWGFVAGRDTIDFFYWNVRIASVGEARGIATVTGTGSFTMAASGIGEVMLPSGGYINSSDANDVMAPDGSFMNDV